MNVSERKPNNLSEDSSSNLMEYVYLLWHWAWLIILVGVLVGGAIYLVSKHTTPVYETTTCLLVSCPSSTGSIDSTSLVPGVTVTQTYSQMVTDTQVLDQVILHLSQHEQGSPSSMKMCYNERKQPTRRSQTNWCHEPDPKSDLDV